MPAQIFKGKTFAAAGPLPGQMTIENMKRWASLRKGVFLDDFDESVTHLLCTKEQFDKKILRIKEALKRKRVNIIHVDWFEFSTVKNAKLDESDYSMRNIQAKDNAKKRERVRREKGRRNGEKFVNTNFFHLYRDRENFVYEVDITRDDNQTGELGQKYTLYLWESNATPHLYRFTAKFLKRKGSSQPSYFRPSPCEGKWRAEMDLFMDFFKKKTGIEWQDRITFAHTGLTSMFQYTPPTGGRPVGRRLRHDLDYCREINAQIRGLPWPPIKDSEEESVSTEDDSNSGPRTFDDDHDMIDSPPGAENISEKHESVATTTQVGEVETHKHQPQGGLETPPRDEKGEPRTAPTSLIPSISGDTNPIKIATPAPSSDGNDVLESSVGISAISSKEIGIEVSLEPEPQKPKAALTSAVESAPDNASSSELAAPPPSSDEKEVVDVSANDDSRVLDKETDMWISLDFEPREPL
ncbi:hypothetical protein FHETE_94 [Fusarium heterosporum]|uniref:BRCT domain-containing protein n=1 Tax=Fusarium heterosporum TaxID=42747 RepID=A0A8H5X4H6_FUSHE|nr:hypothetical protein FHETE_94 [Fusarium heterosporum]